MRNAYCLLLCGLLLASCSSTTTAKTGAVLADATDVASFDVNLLPKTDVVDGSSQAADAAADTLSDTSAQVDIGADVPTTCPGAPGCSCAVGGDCAKGLCIDTTEGKRCSQPCAPACPSGYHCAAPSAGGAQVCLPTALKLCQPCLATKDCEALGESGALCIDEGPLGRFCGIACNSDDDCPQNYGCQVAQSAEGPKAKQCVKLAAVGSKDAYGLCSCTPASKAAAASTACYGNQTNLGGKVVGQCPGLRMCAPTGLGACILTAPKADVCDGVDNDCNGQVDDNASGCTDGETCTEGKCTKGCTPTDGGWSAWTWGSCTKSCGGGSHSATRTCSNPAPSCGGAACVGDSIQSEACNTQACIGNELPPGTSVYATAEQVVDGLVPASVSVLTVQLWGGGGGGGYPGNGGGGGYVKASIPVQGGDTIGLRVAGFGEAGGGGGGASLLSKNGKVILMVGGGGGAGVDGCSGCIGSAMTGAGGGGGAAGQTAPSGSADNAYSTNSGGGSGGSQVAGGSGGVQSNASGYSGCEAQGLAGAASTGGACAGGYQCLAGPFASSEKGGTKCIGNGSGGAGGAGWFGGGSGSAKYTYSGGGGGGGSSWLDASATLIDTAAGVFDAPGGSSAIGYQGNAGRGGLGVQNSPGAKPASGMPGLIILTL